MAIALPMMESLSPLRGASKTKKPVKRFVCLSNNYGVYQKAFFPDPAQAGKNYDMPETLKALEKHREKWEENIKRERAMKQEEAQDEVAQTVFLGRRRDS